MMKNYLPDTNSENVALIHLMDIFTEITGLPILFIKENNFIVYSNKNRPKYYQNICEIIGPKACNLDSMKFENEGLHMCPSGLWAYFQPSFIDGNRVGTFLFGHCRILGRENESKRALEKIISEYKIDIKNSVLLHELLEMTPIVDFKTFEHTKLIEQFSIIEKYITIERDLSMAFKSEAISLAHEFLLPIQSIVADAENLYNLVDEKNFEIKNTAEDILQSVIKLSYIAENIRGSFFKENKDEFIEFSLVDIYKIIQETTDLFGKEARKKRIIIRLTKENNLSYDIEGSEPHLKQVFFNLIHNAVKYSCAGLEGSDITISINCKKYNEIFSAEITNYGIGILPEEISNGLIFKDGYRGILSRDRSRIGSGYGLSRVKQIVKAHNGYIEVESKNVGVGIKIDPYLTTFKVYIPYQQMKGKTYETKENIMDRR